MNKIDFYGLSRPFNDRDILSRWTKILQDNTFIEGHYNNAFEKRFAKHQEVQHCLLVGNGTDALEIALQSCGVSRGDKVGVPGITFYASAEAIVNVGATPVLIDVDEKTGLICCVSLERIIKKHRLTALIPVHIYGLPADMKKIETLCSPQGISIIEDAAQAFGACYPDTKRPIGSRRNLTTFSFYPTKNLGAAGDAGCILSQEEHISQKISALRNHGRGLEEISGRNSRCDHIQAALLDLKLDYIEHQNKRRKEIASLYRQNLDDLPFRLLPAKYLELSSWHLHPIYFEQESIRQKLGKYLWDQGIETKDFYSKSLSQELWLKNTEGESAQAEKMAGKVLNLPCHPLLTNEEIDYISQQIKNFFG